MVGLPEYLVILSEPDPVASAVARALGTPPSEGLFVDGIPIRRLNDRVVTLHRSARHIHDEGLDALLPRPLRVPPIPLVFPSIHRSESGQAALTVHPLGNPGKHAEVGGQPGRLTPAAPRLMAAALRALSDAGNRIGLPATFEATHHGPLLDHPAFFVEIGGDSSAPRADAVTELSRIVADLRPDPTDRIAAGLGGGHYAPHFTDLVRDRRWAIGHMLSRHAIVEASDEVLAEAIRRTPEADGWVLARAADWSDRYAAWGPRLLDGDAPRRNR